jgi:hypothetical protein
MIWTIDGCISMQNLDIVRGDNRIAMLDCENEALCDDDIIANARLISAAPDLLAACEAFLEFNSACDFNYFLIMKDLAQTAVNKVKGN